MSETILLGAGPGAPNTEEDPVDSLFVAFTKVNGNFAAHDAALVALDGRLDVLEAAGPPLSAFVSLSAGTNNINAANNYKNGTIFHSAVTATVVLDSAGNNIANGTTYAFLQTAANPITISVGGSVTLAYHADFDPITAGANAVAQVVKRGSVWHLFGKLELA